MYTLITISVTYGGPGRHVHYGSRHSSFLSAYQQLLLRVKNLSCLVPKEDVVMQDGPEDSMGCSTSYVITRSPENYKGAVVTTNTATSTEIVRIGSAPQSEEEIFQARFKEFKRRVRAYYTDMEPEKMSYELSYRIGYMEGKEDGKKST